MSQEPIPTPDLIVIRDTDPSVDGTRFDRKTMGTAIHIGVHNTWVLLEPTGEFELVPEGVAEIWHPATT